MDSTVEIQCPWCFEIVEIWVDPESRGKMIRDCEVCCRPWVIFVSRDSQGRLQVQVNRSNQ